MTAPSPQSEWPLRIAADRVAERPLELEVEAEPAVRAALATRFDIPSVDALHAHVRLSRRRDGDIEVFATLAARVVQLCVVTLEPVAETVDCAVEGRFTGQPLEPAESEVLVDPDDDSDTPEPIVDGQIELGEWLAQQLSLAMNPYPRAPGAALDAEAAGEGGAAADGPFAKLAQLRRREPD
ncbi:MAG: DUF177 domain-containing protein [Alphaproteobacteria bacterium]